MIKKILVANRGEIAMRIFRTCRVMNISTVAVYTHVDRGALHVRYAEEAYCISSSPEDTSYLKPELTGHCQKDRSRYSSGIWFPVRKRDFRPTLSGRKYYFYRTGPRNDGGNGRQDIRPY